MSWLSVFGEYLPNYYLSAYKVVLDKMYRFVCPGAASVWRQKRKHSLMCHSVKHTEQNVFFHSSLCGSSASVHTKRVSFSPCRHWYWFYESPACFWIWETSPDVDISLLLPVAGWQTVGFFCQIIYGVCVCISSCVIKGRETLLLSHTEMPFLLHLTCIS